MLDPKDSTPELFIASIPRMKTTRYLSWLSSCLQAADRPGWQNIRVFGPYTDGTVGTSSFLYIVKPGIFAVNLTGSAGQFVLDDLATGADVVPEPTSVVLIAPLVSLLLSRRFRREILRRYCAASPLQRVPPVEPRGSPQLQNRLQ